MSLLPNTVINGNCLEVMKEIDDASIDMILCDLPYGATQNSWDSVIPPAPLWEQYERIIKPNGAILLFGQDKFTATMMLSNPKLHRYNIPSGMVKLDCNLVSTALQTTSGRLSSPANL